MNSVYELATSSSPLRKKVPKNISPVLASNTNSIKKGLLFLVDRIHFLKSSIC